MVCPSCAGTLVDEDGRLICPSCESAQCSLADLGSVFVDMVPSSVRFEAFELRPGSVRCPRCAVVMTRTALRPLVGEPPVGLEEPWPEVDSCATHGIWFQTDALIDTARRCLSLVLASGPQRFEA
jgi:uncharacterized Zn finger protein (UPF0148 family)